MRRARVRPLLAGLGAAAILAFTVLPAFAAVERQLVADGAALSFAIRPSYDAGGQSPLHLYVGYADANATTPAPAADGQASWYNLNIVETAAFKPPEDCTGEKNQQATLDGVEDVQAWLSDYVQSVAASIGAREQPSTPTLPGPRHACTERFPGFAQSRYPETQTIDRAAEDNYLDKPAAAYACREDPGSSQCASYKQYWPSFSSALRTVVRDGSFEARATKEPSQRSDGLLFGAGDGVVVSIGLARNTATARIDGTTLITEATTQLDDICVMATTTGCTLRIDHLRQVARISRAPGRKPVTKAGTIVTGVSGSGVARDVTAGDLELDQATIPLGGYMTIRAVSTTHSCDPGEADPSIAVADAGGFQIAGSGGEGEAGGSITIGGACARAQAEMTSFEIPSFTPGGSAGIPPRTFVIPGQGGPGLVAEPAPTGPVYGEPRVVTRDVVRVVFRDPIAWRTVRFWGVGLGALALFAGLGFRFRRAPLVVPAARSVDRFVRQFIKG